MRKQGVRDNMKSCYVLFDMENSKDVLGVFETKAKMYVFLIQNYFYKPEYDDLEINDNDFKLEVVVKKEVIGEFYYCETHLHMHTLFEKMNLRYNGVTYGFTHFSFKIDSDTKEIKSVCLFSHRECYKPGVYALVHNCTKIGKNFPLLKFGISKLAPNKLYPVKVLLEDEEE